MREGSTRLRGARVALDARTARAIDVAVARGRIAALGPDAAARGGGARLELDGCLILPGLINAHDHLELDLFPRLGRGPYESAAAWARDIYRPRASPILEHTAVPLATRLRWGGIKNLLCGATTVAHHNPYHDAFDRSFPVRVPRRYGWAHSLAFSPDLARRYRRTPRRWPFFVHLGEAIDGEGEAEIFRLEALGALGPRTVLIHGVALGEPGLDLARRRGASLVWCPTSNLFVLGRSLGAAALASGVPIALGTDSALTAEGDLFDELRAARRLADLAPERLYGMVTTGAAAILRLDGGAGRIDPGGPADVVAVRDRGLEPARTLLELHGGDLELVMVAGRVKLISPALAAQLPEETARSLRPLRIEGTRTVLVAADLGRLEREARAELRAPLRLAGKRIEVLA